MTAREAAGAEGRSLPLRMYGAEPGTKESSALLSPALGTSIGMALLRPECANPSTELVVEDPGGSRAARVVRMPFLDPQKRLARS